jgi:hypothetical protein
MVDDQILDRYQRAGVPLADLRRARMTVGGPPVWMVHPLPPRREPFASWVRLRAAHAQTGLWPFLVGPDLKEVHWQAISELWYDAAAEHGLTADTRSRPGPGGLFRPTDGRARDPGSGDARRGSSRACVG